MKNIFEDLQSCYYLFVIYPILMKTYIIICGFADVVAGGPIYYANKVRYMEQLGWRVIVIPTNKGKKVLIRGMEKFLGPYVPFILDSPNEYNRKQRERLVDYLESFVPKDRGETIIETGTDYTNYWGEALAERIHAKHIVIFLDEQNPRVTEGVIEFYKFKYDREELACISIPVMQNLFKGYLTLEADECCALQCACTNTLDDYEHKINSLIPKSDYNIGYIGRLEKPFFSIIVDEFISFCKRNGRKKITVVFFGGAFEQKTVGALEDKFKSLSNVRVFVTGYLFPLPIAALRKMDVFVSGAGSARVAAKAGVLSVQVDMLSYEPLGIMLDYTFTNYKKCPIGNNISDYLNWILVRKDPKLPLPLEVNYKKDWDFVCECFEEHLKFIEQSSSESAYYDLSQLGISSKQKMRRFFRAILGLKWYNYLRGNQLYLFIWSLIQRFKSSK